LTPDTYACRIFELDEALPWSFIRTGVSGDFLKREYRKSLSGEITENCRVRCEKCGIGCADGGSSALGTPAPSIARFAPSADAVQEKGLAAQQTIRIRCQYTKTGKLRFLSHLDFMALFQRAATRARVPLAFTAGFNPHPKMAYGPALPVGIAGEAEYLDIETDPFVNLEKMIETLNTTLPLGVRILEAKIVPQKTPSLSGSIGRYVYVVEMPERHAAQMESRISDFLSRKSIIVEKEGKKKDIRPAIESITIVPPKIEVVLLETNEVRARIQDVVEQLLGAGPEESALVAISRTGMFVARNGGWVSPMEVK
jgi:radical SAM-linked protein